MLGDLDKQTKIEFLNDCDFAILDIYCQHSDIQLVIEDGRITDYITKEETR